MDLWMYRGRREVTCRRPMWAVYMCWKLFFWQRLTTATQCFNSGLNKLFILNLFYVTRPPFVLLLRDCWSTTVQRLMCVWSEPAVTGKSHANLPHDSSCYCMQCKNTTSRLFNNSCLYSSKPWHNVRFRSFNFTTLNKMIKHGYRALVHRWLIAFEQPMPNIDDHPQILQMLNRYLI